MATDKPYILSVLSGPNTGAAIALPPGVSTIGPDDGSTVILDETSESPVSIGLSGDRIRVLSRAAGVSIRGKGPVAPGSKTAAELPAVIRLDDRTLVAVARYGAPARRRAGPVWPLAILALGALAVGSERLGGPSLIEPARAHVQGFLATIAAEPEAPAARIAEPAPQPQRAGPDRSTACDDACLDADAQALRDRLAEAGLTDLTVTRDNRLLRVTGAVEKGQIGAWRDLRRGFESDRARSVTLVADITERAAPPRIDISAVWLGTTPEVRMRNGARLRVGDLTADGWTIAGIAPEGVRLSKGGLTHLVSY